LENGIKINNAEDNNSKMKKFASMIYLRYENNMKINGRLKIPMIKNEK
jgi:hypothetical protein